MGLFEGLAAEGWRIGLDRTGLDLRGLMMMMLLMLLLLWSRAGFLANTLSFFVFVFKTSLS